MNKVVLYLIFFGCSFYTVKLFTSPTYFLSLLSLFFALAYKSKVEKHFFPIVFMFLVLLLYLLFRVDFQNYLQFGYLVNIVASFCYILSFSLVYKSVDAESIVRVFIHSVFFMVVLMGVDTFFRFYSPMPVEPEVLASLQAKDIGFYLYKNSWLVSDSNTIGLIALSLICSIFFIRKYVNVRLNKIVIRFLFFCLVLILILSISRAAYLGLLFALFMSYGNAKFKAVITPFILMFVVYTLIDLILNDLSFSTKIRIFTQSYDFILNNMEWNDFLFGLGVDGSKLVFIKVAHSFFITIFFDLGIVGVLLFLLVIISMIWYEKRVAIFIFPLMLAGVSYFMYYGAPFFYFICYFLLVIVRLKPV